MDNNHLHINVLQDYIDMNGGTFKFTIKWQRGQIYIEQDEETKGSVVHYNQVPLPAKADAVFTEQILEQMPGLSKVVLNKSEAVVRDVQEPHKIGMDNKYKQAMDFEIVLLPNKPAKIRTFSYFGVQRFEHDSTYVRALFTTNPYFAVIFNGIRIVPYQRDINKFGKRLIQAVDQFAKESIARHDNGESNLHFKVEKAFEITFYLEDQDVTKDIQSFMNKGDGYQTTLDEFGFIAYIAFYQLFNGELNNSIPLNEL